MAQQLFWMRDAAVAAVEDVAMTTPQAYTPSPLSAEDGAAQLFVCAFILIVAAVGMKASLESEAATREAALEDKVRAQTLAMDASTSTTIEAAVGGDASERVRERGVARVDGVMSERASEEMRRYVDETLAASEATRGGALSTEVFGNVYCKKNRWI